MARAGAVWISVLPDMSGWNALVRTQASASLEGAGLASGKGYTSGLMSAVRGSGLASVVEAQAKVAADKAAMAVQSASVKVTAARKREADASGSVRVAELKLAEVRAKENASASSIAAAEERLAKAQRTQAEAADVAAVAAKNLTRAEEAATAATGALSTESTIATKRFSLMGSSVGSSADHMSSKLGGFTKSVASMGGLFAGFEVAKFVGGSIKSAADFEALTTRLVTTAGESQSAIAGVSKGLLDMAPKVGFTATDLANALYDVESGGFHGAAGLKVLEAAAKGARIEGANVTDVAHALTGALNDYKGTTLTAVEATNAMTGAVGSGMMRFQDLAEALPKVGARAAAAHVTFQELLAALGTMTKDGLPASMAATYLGQSIGQLAAPTAKARTEMAGLGIDSVKVAQTITSGSGHGLADALKMLYDGITKHLSPSGLVAIDTFKKAGGSASSFKTLLANLPPTMQTSVQALAAMSGGVRSFQGVLMLGGAHAGQYAQTLKAVNDQVQKGGSEISGFTQQQKTLSGELNDASGAASSLSVSLGQKLTPAAKVAVGDFTDFVGILAKHQDLMMGVLEVTSALGAAWLVGRAAALTQAAAVTLLGGAEGITALKTTALGLATGDYALAADGAAGAATAMAGTLRMAAGAAGIGLLIDGSHRAAGAMSTLEMASGGALAGGFIGSMIAPGVGTAIGAAIGGVAGAAEGLARSTDHVNLNAKVAIGTYVDFEATLNQVTGAITQQTRVQEYQRLQSSGLLTLTRELGLSDREAVSAAMGNVAARMKLTDALGNTTIGTKNQRAALIAETGAVRSATLAQLNQNVATAQGSEALAVAKTALKNFIDSPGNKNVSIDLGNSLAELNSLHDALASLLNLGGKSANSIVGGLGPLLLTPSKAPPHKGGGKYGKAAGGEVSVGTLYKVNELGMEAFAPNVPGRILTAAQTAQTLSGRQTTSNQSLAGQRLRLVVGGKEFDAYVDDRADTRVNSAAALAGQAERAFG